LRIKNANHYNKTLKNQNILQLPKIERDSKNVFHQYTVLVKETSIITRKEIQEKLLEK
jgi:dTDP-4-amino-4,6-dideoxygalactose transaminase